MLLVRADVFALDGTHTRFTSCCALSHIPSFGAPQLHLLLLDCQQRVPLEAALCAAAASRLDCRVGQHVRQCLAR